MQRRLLRRTGPCHKHPEVNVGLSRGAKDLSQCVAPGNGPALSNAHCCIIGRFEIHFWDARTGAHIKKGMESELFGAVGQVQFSPDGTSVLALSRESSYVSAGGPGDVKTGEIVKEWDAHEGSVTALLFSSQGLLASGGEDRTLKFWRSGTKEASLKGHESSIRALAFSSDGQFVAAATGNRSLCVWSVAEEKLVNVLRPPVRLSF